MRNREHTYSILTPSTVEVSNEVVRPGGYEGGGNRVGSQLVRSCLMPVVETLCERESEGDGRDSRGYCMIILYEYYKSLGHHCGISSAPAEIVNPILPNLPGVSLRFSRKKSANFKLGLFVWVLGHEGYGGYLLGFSA